MAQVAAVITLFLVSHCYLVRSGDVKALRLLVHMNLTYSVGP
jgi:hypothetical protein